MSRAWRPWARVGFGLAVAAILVPSATAIQVRDDLLDGSWIVGHLTWKDGKGGICWASACETEDPGGQPDDADPANLPAPDEFVSDPLPWTLYLNVSHAVQVEVHFVQSPRSASCDGGGHATPTSMEVSIRVDEALLGGATSQSFTPSETNPAIPGYDGCKFRVSPELRVLPAGARLHLKLAFTSTNTDGNAQPRYGLREPHASVIRLPHYLPEELFWRDPDYFEDTWATPAPSGSLLDALLAPLGALVAAGATAVPAASGRRGTRVRIHARPALLVAVLVLVSLAGCLGGNHAPPSASPLLPDPEGLVTSNVEDAKGLDFSEEGKGTVLGVVHDEYLVPIARVHLSLLGSAVFAESNAMGRFHFLNVTAGRHHVRADRLDYHSIEFDVGVEADQVTRVQVTLLPLVPRGPDERPHRHDYWNGADTLDVYTADLGRCTQTGTGLSCSGPTSPTSAFGIPPHPKEGTDLVVPGTQEVEVIVMWMSAATATLPKLYVQNNADPSFENWTEYLARPWGNPFHVQTNWEMEDAGHQSFSTWRFFVDTYAPSTKDPLAKDGPMLHVVIRLHRGVVPLEPAHPDHWAGQNERRVELGQTWVSSYGGTNQLLSTTLIHPGGCLGDSRGSDGGWWGLLRADWLPPPRVVPQGTGRLTVTVSTSHATRDAATGGYGLELWYKGGHEPVQRFTTAPAPIYSATNVPDNAPSPAFSRAPDPSWSSDGKTATWTLSIKPEQADGIYNKRSSWQFVTMPDDPTAGCLDAHAHALTTTPLTLGLTVTAKRDPSSA